MPSNADGPVRQVNTVTGPVPADSLGFVLPHEHLVWGDAGWQFDTVAAPERDDLLRLVVAMLDEAASTGVGAVFDPTPAEMGRDVDLMAEASERSGIKVVFATGVYSRWPTPYFAHRSAEELADFFGTELTEGVGAGRAKPGFVKVAIEDVEFTGHERAALQAAARVHGQLDTPILVHCQPRVGIPVLRLLVGELGVAGDAIVVAHAEGVRDLAHHLQIVEEFGSSVGFDRFGLATFGVPDEVRVALVTALCARGHAEKVHLSHDFAGVNLGRGGTMLAERRASMPDWRVSHVGNTILPRLRAAGVSAEQIRLMCEVGPARWLARQ